MESNPSLLERIATLNPALLRGSIVAIFGIIVAVTGHQVDNATVDLVVNGVLALLALVAAIVIRPAVTPNGKVVVMKPNPIDQPGVVAPGEATVGPAMTDEVVQAALRPAA